MDITTARPPWVWRYPVQQPTLTMSILRSTFIIGSRETHDSPLALGVHIGPLSSAPPGQPRLRKFGVYNSYLYMSYIYICICNFWCICWFIIDIIWCLNLRLNLLILSHVYGCRCLHMCASTSIPKVAPCCSDSATTTPGLAPANRPIEKRLLRCSC